MCVGSPTAGTWSSSQWRADNEFETHRAGRSFLMETVTISSFDEDPSYAYYPQGHDAVPGHG
jgi:hypothetical protein